MRKRPFAPTAYAWLVVLAMLIIARVAIAPWGLPNVYNDSQDYYAQSRLSVWSILAAHEQPFYQRPIVPALLFKFSGYRQEGREPLNANLVVSQILISALSLAAILLAGRRWFRGMAWMVWAVFWFALSTGPLVFPWDGIALSESASQNSLILLVAAFLESCRRGALSRGSAAFIAVAAALCALSRDSNLLVAMLFLPTFALVRWLGWRPAGQPGLRSLKHLLDARSWMVLGALSAVVLFAGWHMSRRSTYQNAILISFVAHRMPKSPELFAEFERRFNPPFPTSAKEMLEEYRTNRGEMEQWVGRAYQPAHFRFLLSHPGSTIFLLEDGIYSAIFKFARGRLQYWYLHDIGHAPQALEWPTAVSRAIHKVFSAPLRPLATAKGTLYWPLALLAAVMSVAWWRRVPRLGLFALFLTAACYAEFALCLLTAGVEDYRHCLAGIFGYAVLAWLAIGSLITALAWRWRAKWIVPAQSQSAVEEDFQTRPAAG